MLVPAIWPVTRTRAVGFLSQNILGDFFIPLLRGIESVIGRRGYALLVASRQALLDGVIGGNEAVPPLGPHNADGLIAFADSLSGEDFIVYTRGDSRLC